MTDDEGGRAQQSDTAHLRIAVAGGVIVAILAFFLGCVGGWAFAQRHDQPAVTAVIGGGAFLVAGWVIWAYRRTRGLLG